MTHTAGPWVESADSLPEDGVRVEWREAGKLVAGFRFGALWLLPNRGDPVYCRRPARWRYVEGR